MYFVLTFKITPYSDADIASLSALTINEIYSLLQSQTSTAILTYILSSILNLNNPSTDKLFLSNNLMDLAIYPQVFVLLKDGQYMNHIYAWTINNMNNDESVTNITKISDLYLEVVPILLNSVRKWINEVNEVNEVNHINQEEDVNNLIRVLNPPLTMVSLLRHSGFICARSLRNNNLLSWLFDNHSIGNINFIEGSLSREYDYLSPINNMCMSPEFIYKSV